MGREIKRVEANFSWPLGEIWKGFINPHDDASKQCDACGGEGYSPEGRALKDKWYGYVPFRPEDNGSTPFSIDTPEVRAFAERNVANSPEYYGTGEGAVRREALRLTMLWNSQWSHHLNADDVAVLLAKGRLMDLTHTWTKETRWQPRVTAVIPTPREVNLWSISGGFGHDSSNAYYCIRAACERAGHPVNCAVCAGEGQIWESVEAKQQYEDWQQAEPPAGEWWQLWETVSEGSPVTPAFASSAELVGHLVKYGDAWDQRRKDGGWSLEAALQMVKDAWASSMIVTAAGGICTARRPAMNLQDIRQEVERIRALVYDRVDYEAAHSCEGNLHRSVLRAIAEGRCANPADAAYEALKTQEIEFERWCG